jgi:3-methyladenine DNA glycosylase AlkC
MVSTKTAMGEEQFKLYQEKEYPSPQSIPRPPSTYEPKPQVALADLTAKSYVKTVGRAVYLKTTERQDELGSKVIFSGILEDATFKMPFVSHKLNIPWQRDTVYKFDNAYVHEFPDRSFLLVITEFTDWQLKIVDGYLEYQQFVWKPKIATIKRPIQNISLVGTITTVHNNSGLVKRCNGCKSLLYDDCCPNKCDQGWGWDLRVSSRLYDGSGSIKMVMTKDVASRILQRNLSELILLATQTKLSPDNNSNTTFLSSSIYRIKVPESVEVLEAVTESPSSYRKSDKMIVSDGRNLVFIAPNEQHYFIEFNNRTLNPVEVEDKKIIRRLIEKAVDINIRKQTGKGMLQGIYLLEDPLKLYRCEKASLYLGFSLNVYIKQKQEGDSIIANVEATPQAYVRESALDYIRMRRENGATANGLIRHLVNARNKVIVAPSGNYGSIIDVITRKASNQTISETDNRNLVQFWHDVYDIDISPDEMPLLKVKMMNSEQSFTYPASMVFFGNESLVISAGLQKFIDDKKANLKFKMDRVVEKALNGLCIGEAKLEFEGNKEESNNIQTVLLQEIKEKLYGKEVKTSGSIIFVHDELWFFPNQLQFSYSKHSQADLF